MNGQVYHDMGGLQYNICYKFLANVLYILKLNTISEVRVVAPGACEDGECADGVDIKIASLR